MSCNSCGSSQPCGCNYIVELPDNPVVAYTCANINLTGIGVYDSQNGNEFDFRGITSGNNSLLVTLDAANNSILLTFNIQQIIDDLPDATTTQRGVLETATNAEAIGKALDNKILTPKNLAAIGATSSFAGLIEIATNAEALAGASTSLAITPANLSYVNSSQKTTQVFADAVARAAAVPDFVGQYGYQQDTFQPYVGYAISAGSWNVVIGDAAPNVLSSFTQTINSTASPLRFIGSRQYYDDSSYENNSSVKLLTGSTIDFQAGSVAKVASVSIPANSVLITSGTAGYVGSALINTFVSTANTQTGYTTFSNPATLRTCDTATVTLQQLAQIVGTLISDLKAVKLPST